MPELATLSNSVSTNGHVLTIEDALSAVTTMRDLLRVQREIDAAARRARFRSVLLSDEPRRLRYEARGARIRLMRCTFHGMMFSNWCPLCSPLGA